ncbi:hypothetical protein Sste5346_008387 [Sporothrix stenoceras]|uniref:Bromo domain-containing protein n=1 Tax=Sporothrix stenoceras TaxID=5173 RepID=A0ABR3YQU7_9PEZI
MTTTTSSSSSFTPLESLLLFQSILKHGVEPDAFGRIADVLRQNPFIKSDDRYNADRLTGEALQQLFVNLLREFDSSASESAGGAAGSGEAADKNADTKDKNAAGSTADAQLPTLVERLYVRYRDNIVHAIREDERCIEKVQAEIKLLEQQAAGGGGRGAHAKAAAAAAAQNKLQQQQQQQQQHVAQQQQLQAGQAGSAASSRSNSASAPPPSARHTPEQHQQQHPSQQRASSNVPLLPATARPPNQQNQQQQQQQQPNQPTPADAASSSTPSRLNTASPALQQQTRPQLAPLAPAITPASPSQSQPPSRTPSAVAIQPSQPSQPTQPTQPLQHTRPPSVAASTTSSQPASRPISPAQPPPHIAPAQQQQAVVPPNANAAQIQTLPPKTAAPPLHTPGTQTPTIPNSPSMTQSAQSAAAAASSVPPSQVGTPRPLVPATQQQQKHLPIAPTPTPQQFQRVPGGPPSTPGPGPGLVPRPPLPEHVRIAGGPPSRTPTPIQSPRPNFPHTPVQGIAAQAAMFLPRGSGTRWKPSDPTPSTPGPDVGDMASPAYEPLSPVQPSAAAAASDGDDGVNDDDDDAATSPVSPSASAQRQSRNLRRPQQHLTTATAPTATTRTRGRPSRHSRSQDDDGHPIKAEASTPNVGDINDIEMGDDSRAALKRKRGNGDDDDESVNLFLNTTTKPDPSVLARRRLVGPPTPPTHVLWMRGFPKISASALDQISSHRHANMFAHKIRDRDAPGYGSIVRHPVDLKSIRMAITQGNKAANAAVSTLSEEERDSGNSSVWLPINADLVPPRGIINSSQLECELVHMFANAVMYNPDSHRGPGLSFLVGEADDDDDDDPANADNTRYKVDEDGVVNDTRDMYVEVEKLLSEMRSAERQRGMPAPPVGARGLDLPLDDVEAAAEGSDDDKVDDDKTVKNDKEKTDKNDDDAADDEGSGTVKRRRITRGQ